MYEPRDYCYSKRASKCVASIWGWCLIVSMTLQQISLPSKFSIFCIETHGAHSQVSPHYEATVERLDCVFHGKFVLIPKAGDSTIPSKEIHLYLLCCNSVQIKSHRMPVKLHSPHTQPHTVANHIHTRHTNKLLERRVHSLPTHLVSVGFHWREADNHYFPSFTNNCHYAKDIHSTFDTAPCPPLLHKLSCQVHSFLLRLIYD